MQIFQSHIRSVRRYVFHEFPIKNRKEILKNKEKSIEFFKKFVPEEVKKAQKKPQKAQKW